MYKYLRIKKNVDVLSWTYYNSRVYELNRKIIMILGSLFIYLKNLFYCLKRL